MQRHVWILLAKYVQYLLLRSRGRKIGGGRPDAGGQQNSEAENQGQARKEGFQFAIIYTICSNQTLHFQLTAEIVLYYEQKTKLQSYQQALQPKYDINLKFSSFAIIANGREWLVWEELNHQTTSYKK
jgi:hypothetical protein